MPEEHEVTFVAPVYQTLSDEDFAKELTTYIIKISETDSLTRRLFTGEDKMDKTLQSKKELAIDEEAIPMVEEKTWEEFRNSKLLWWINRTLHLFGWAIVYEFEEDSLTKELYISRVYPARVKFRGFDTTTETNGFIDLTGYLKDNITDLLEEAKN